MKKINALILAAGEGTRLRPLTNSTPKPLIRIDGQTLLARRIDALLTIPEIGKIGVTVGYLREPILLFLARYKEYKDTIIGYSCPRLMGTAEATLNAWKILGKEEPLIVFYGDVYPGAPETDYPVLIKMYLNEAKQFSLIGYGPLKNPPSGVMQVNKDSKVTEFIEHPSLAKIKDGAVSHAEWLILAPSVYPILEKSLMYLMACWDKPDQFPINLGEHFLPKAVQETIFYATDVGEHYDIGTIEQYCALQQKVYNNKLRSQLDPKLHLIFKALFRFRGDIWIIGNGGSLVVAQHAALDLSKAAGRRAICASDAARITAYSNDISFEQSYSEYLANLLAGEGILIALSASGESPNILRAVKEANEKYGVLTIGLTKKGSSLSKVAELALEFEEEDPKALEDMFQITFHKIVRMLEDAKW